MTNFDDQPTIPIVPIESLYSPEDLENGKHFVTQMKSSLDKHFPGKLDEIKRNGGTIISIGCGDFTEGPQLNQDFPNSKIIGIDIDENFAIIGDTRTEISNLNIEHIQLDAEQPYTIQDVNLAIIRSPYPGANWNHIVQNALANLNYGGLIYITVIRHEEQE